MKFVIAPDAFKESLSAREVGESIAAGFRDIFPDADCLSVPMADGGEGTVQALVDATGGRLEAVTVTGPLGDRIRAFYGISGNGETAFVEMAAASGLALVPTELRNPMVTTSYGTGELIRHALDKGIQHLIIGIGGSATNDGGVGMLQALGVRLLDRSGRDLNPGGQALEHLATIDIKGLDARLHGCIDVACDVDNPLTGPRGASVVFGPQKGATADMVETLDANLSLFAEVIAHDLNREVATVPGSGAAGGMGASLIAFLGAHLRPGIDIVVEAVGLESALQGANLVITGEGRMDGQTVHGKTPVGVARVAAKLGIPVIAIAGSLGPGVDAVYGQGINAIFSIIDTPCSLSDALAGTAENLRHTARNIAATIKVSAAL